VNQFKTFLKHKAEKEIIFREVSRRYGILGCFGASMGQRYQSSDGMEFSPKH
jgi:hypothetical protein